MITRTITITEEQETWLQKNKQINLSGLTQNAITQEMMKHE
jgi:post-segregation antitoxin (ccd killing protein)